MNATKDHEEAYRMALINESSSNMSRCYLELRVSNAALLAFAQAYAEQFKAAGAMPLDDEALDEMARVAIAVAKGGGMTDPRPAMLDAERREMAQLRSSNAELVAELSYVVTYFRGGMMPSDLRDWCNRADAAIAAAKGEK